MRRTRLIGSCLALACACALIGAAGASATLPELGRCVNVGVGGGYTGQTCLVKSKTHNGPYEWMPGPGESKGLKFKLTLPEIETTGGGKIGCAFLFATGEFTGAKSLKISEVQIQGCEMLGPKLACYTNPLEPNKIVSKLPLVGELGDIPGSTNPANPWLGWDLKAEVGSTIVEGSCGESGGPPPPPPPNFTVVLEGSVIGRVRPTDKMVNPFAIVYKQSLGIQSPEAFIGGTKDTLTQVTTPTTNPQGKKTEEAGLKTSGELAPEELLEVKAK